MGGRYGACNMDADLDLGGDIRSCFSSDAAMHGYKPAELDRSLLGPVSNSFQPSVNPMGCGCTRPLAWLLYAFFSSSFKSNFSIASSSSQSRCGTPLYREDSMMDMTLLVIELRAARLFCIIVSLCMSSSLA